MRKIMEFADLDWYLLYKIEKKFLDTHDEYVWNKDKSKIVKKTENLNSPTNFRWSGVMDIEQLKSLGLAKTGSALSARSKSQGSK